MAEYDNTNSGVIFVNDKRGNENAPDRSGTVNIEGREYRISGWIKDREGNPLKKKDGTPFMKLRFTLKEGQQPAPKATPKPAPVADFDDDLAF